MVSAQNAKRFGTNGSRSQEAAEPGTVKETATEQARLLSGTGTIYSFSVMYNVPQGFEEQKPYVIAIVQLDEGPMVTAQLTDINHAEVTIGQRVEMVTRKLREEGNEGQIIYGYKFRPTLQDSISA